LESVRIKLKLITYSRSDRSWNSVIKQKRLAVESLHSPRFAKQIVQRTQCGASVVQGKPTGRGREAGRSTNDSQKVPKTKFVFGT
jgi:hypothetical protein